MQIVSLLKYMYVIRPALCNIWSVSTLFTQVCLFEYLEQKTYEEGVFNDDFRKISP